MNRTLLRPSAAFFPLAGLIASALGHGEGAARLFFWTYALQLLSLCAVDCFRNGAAREPGVRRVDRRFGGTLAQLTLGSLLLGLCAWRLGCWDPCAAVAALCICIEQLFEERMFALSRRVDGFILSLVANLLLITGLLLDGGGLQLPLPGFCAACGAGLGAGIAAVAAYALEPAHGFSLKPVNLALAPRACLQTLLYPAAGAGVLALANARGAPIAPLPLFAGLILWRLARTVARRSADESRPLNLLLIAAAALSAGVAALLPGALSWAVALLLALVCAGAVFCAPGARLWCGAALCAAALALAALHPLPQIINAAAACALCAAAILINLKRAFLRRI